MDGNSKKRALTTYQEFAMDPESPYAAIKRALLEAMGENH